jgi:hypothetical protein
MNDINHERGILRRQIKDDVINHVRWCRRRRRAELQAQRALLAMAGASASDTVIRITGSSTVAIRIDVGVRHSTAGGVLSLQRRPAERRGGRRAGVMRLMKRPRRPRGCVIAINPRDR